MKPNRPLSKLLIRDLAKFSGQTFKYEDRLTRAEAQQLEAWARSNQAVVQAYLNGSHPENKAVKLYVETVRHFQYEHAQDAGGEPVPWPAPTAAEARALPADNPFGAKTAEEAAALLAWAETTPEYRDAYMNRSHPQHKDYVEQTAQLRELVTPTAVVDAGQAFADAVGTGQAAPPAPLPLSDAKTLDIVRNVAAVHAAREQTHTARQSGTSPTPQQVAAQQAADRRVQSMRDGTFLKDRIREAQKHPAYLDAKHPEHAAAVRAAADAYRDAYPEPAAGAGAEGAPPGATVH